MSARTLAAFALRLPPILILAGAFALVGGTAHAYKRVQPSAHPSQPTQSEEVVIRFRTRQTLDGRYHAEAQHEADDPACELAESGVRSAPRKGRVVRLKLRPPRVDGDSEARQWCTGTYRVKVFFKQNVSCPPTISCGDSAARRMGSTTFTVVAAVAA